MEIIPPKEKKGKSTDVPLTELAPTWDKRTFRGLVVGKAGGGKSVMIDSLVRHYLDWQTLTVIAKHLGGPLYEDLREWVEKKEEKKGRTVSVWGESLEQLPPLDVYTPENRNLVWIDDLMNEPKKAQVPVVEMFTSGRHKNIGIIYTAQSYGRVPADIKRNASFVCIYRGYSAHDVDNLWANHGGLMTKAEFAKFLAFATKEPYSFATIDEQCPHEALRARFRSLHGGGLFDIVKAAARPLVQRGIEEAKKKAVEAAGQAAGKVVGAVGDRAVKAIRGGALAQKGETLEDQLRTGTSAGPILALQALGEPVRGKGFARNPKASKAPAGKQVAPDEKRARKHVKKNAAALAALAAGAGM